MCFVQAATTRRQAENARSNAEGGARAVVRRNALDWHDQYITSS
jgi:hypothetical protein